ncbi:MAG TPA: hypothetical protein VK994_01365, partial [Bacteroidales bacterium]|nr:hypothetical protein [Bacteroidales bacterium]
MAAKHYKWLFTFPAILLLIFIFSCSVERKIAREFIKDDSTRTALVMPPDFLFKTSLKDYEFEEA